MLAIMSPRVVGIGMLGWMAMMYFEIFAKPPVLSEPTYWFRMQIAMILGLLTSYPANWWLVQKGIKEEV